MPAWPRIWAIWLIAYLAILASVSPARSSDATGEAPQTADRPDDDDAPPPLLDRIGRSVTENPLHVLTGGMPDRMMMFAGSDLWRNGGTGFVGVQWAARHLDDPGFFVRLFYSGSIESYHAPSGISYRTAFDRLSLTPGYKFTARRFELQLAAGPELQLQLDRVDRYLTDFRIFIGLKATADLWWEPTAQLMFQANAHGSFIDSAASGRIAVGWRPFDGFWVGPEFIYARDVYSHQQRYGLHLTGLRTGMLQWNFASGYIRDSMARDGIYGRIGLHWRVPRKAFFEN